MGWWRRWRQELAEVREMVRRGRELLVQVGGTQGLRDAEVTIVLLRLGLAHLEGLASWREAVGRRSLN